MRLTGVAPVILGFLRIGPRSGYEIKQAVDRSTRFFWAASYGQIYPELRRLEAAGLVEGESAPRGGRRRNVYRLTRAGEEALRDWLRAPHAGYEVRDLGLLKLFFASAVDPDATAALVRDLRADRERTLERLRQIKERAGLEDGDSRELVLAYGIAVHEWEVEWFKRAEKRLAKRAPKGRVARTAA
jgi:PadR family transcriptional regulator AphA